MRQLTQNPRWKQRPPGSTWGDWGPDDQLGRLNLLTPAKVLQGLATVSEGRTFCLSLPLDYPGGTALNPRRAPPELRPTLRGGWPNMAIPLRRMEPAVLDVMCDDQVLMTLQYSTQWDSLAHVGQHFDVNGDGKPVDVFYNGYRAGSDIAGPIIYDEDGERPNEGPHGALRLGVENMAVSCIQGRGIMIDLEAHYGRSGQIIGYEELRTVLDRDDIVIEPGDLVCLRTGYDRLLLKMNRQPDEAVLHSSTSALDGRDGRLLQWITDSGIVALIADNLAVEAVPARPCADAFCAKLPLHAHCLFRLGTYLGELWYLSELADWLREHRRNSFLLTAPPLRLPGAVGRRRHRSQRYEPPECRDG